MENKNNAAILPEKKEAYEAPVIEIVEVKVEHGVQMSVEPPGTDPSDPNPTE